MEYLVAGAASNDVLLSVEFSSASFAG